MAVFVYQKNLFFSFSQRLALPSSATAFEQVGRLLTHLAKSRHLLRFLRARDAADRRLLATLLRTVHRRTVELMPEGGVRSRWEEARVEIRVTAATNGGHIINHHHQDEDHDDDEEEEEDPETWRRRLKTLQDFLYKQQVAEFFELKKAKRKKKENDLHRDSIKEVRAGEAMADDEQLRQLVPFPAYPRLRSSSDTAPFRCCPFCRLPDHFLLAHCQLKKEVQCFLVVFDVFVLD